MTQEEETIQDLNLDDEDELQLYKEFGVSKSATQVSPIAHGVPE